MTDRSDQFVVEKMVMKKTVFGSEILDRATRNLRGGFPTVPQNPRVLGMAVPRTQMEWGIGCWFAFTYFTCRASVYNLI